MIGVQSMMPELSVVIPIHNEAASLEQLHRELTATLGAAGLVYNNDFGDKARGAERRGQLAMQRFERRRLVGNGNENAQLGHHRQHIKHTLEIRAGSSVNH